MCAACSLTACFGPRPGRALRCTSGAVAVEAELLDETGAPHVELFVEEVEPAGIEVAVAERQPIVPLDRAEGSEAQGPAGVVAHLGIGCTAVLDEPCRWVEAHCGGIEVEEIRLQPQEQL